MKKMGIFKYLIIVKNEKVEFLKNFMKLFDPYLKKQVTIEVF